MIWEFIQKVSKAHGVRPKPKGLKEGEIERIRLDQGVPRLPGLYAEFLAVAGRSAGILFRGTDLFYPSIIGIRNDTRELFRENEIDTDLFDDDAVVFGMHQGYVAYWMTDYRADDPPVMVFEEQETFPRSEYRSLSSFIQEEVEVEIEDARSRGRLWY